MRQVKIEYENFERPENQELVAGLIETYSFLFPVWLKTLTVSVYDKHVDEDKWNAWNNGSPEYGTASIEMMVLCLDKSTQYLHELIAHELLHIAHMRVYELMHNRLMAGLEESNPDLYGFLKEDLRQEVEKFVENTAVGIVGFAQELSVVHDSASNARPWTPRDLEVADLVRKRCAQETPHD